MSGPNFLVQVGRGTRWVRPIHWTGSGGHRSRKCDEGFAATNTQSDRAPQKPAENSKSICAICADGSRDHRAVTTRYLPDPLCSQRRPDCRRWPTCPKAPNILCWPSSAMLATFGRAISIHVPTRVPGTNRCRRTVEVWLRDAGEVSRASLA